MGLHAGNHAEKDRLNVLDQVQKKAAQFTNHMKDSDWETLAQNRTTALMHTFYSVLWGTGLESYR
jgi:hypothetical protein